MADSKITALTALTAADPANDMFPVVDVSDTTMAASGTTKRISINNLLACSPSATLASATISGDLTVDTSTLKVDSANNRVGIGTASPNVRMELSVADAAEGARLTASSAWLRIFPYLDATDKTKIQAVNGTNTALSDLTIEGLNLRFLTNAGLSYAISNTSVHTWQNVGGVAGTAMTLNATGLGVGVASPAAKLDVAGNAALTGTSGFKYLYFNLATDTNSVRGAKIGKNYDSTFALNIHATTAASGGSNEAPINFYRNNTDISMTLDASGRLLVGTTVLNASWDTRLTLSSDIGTTRWAVGPYVAPQNFVISAGAGTGVYLNGTAATSWTSLSDERLKDIIEPISNAVSKVASLRAVIGKFKFDENNTRKPFLIAQDIQAVLPEAVDASNPDKLGVAYTDVIPLLVAAIKELTARVQTLEAK